MKKAKKKSSFSTKTRIIAMILALVTALSVMTVSVGSVSAAENKAAAATSGVSNGIDTDGLIKGLTTSVVGKIIDVGTKSNPVTAVLGAGVSSVFGSLFGSLFPQEDKTQKEILTSVREISRKVDQNHTEEMTALASIEQMIQSYSETIIDELEMQSFNNSCKNMKNLYTSVFDQLYYGCKELPVSPKPAEATADEAGSDREYKLIDRKTYDAYSKILQKTGFDSSIDIEAQFNDIYIFLDAAQDNFYQVMINKYVNAIQRKGPSDFDDVCDYRSIKSNIEQIEADVILYYTAYTTLLQMDYQCENYRYNQSSESYEELSMDSTVAEINDATEKLSKINDAFNSAYNSIDGLATASVTADGTTKYFAFTPLAWSVAVKSANNGHKRTTCNILKDWVAPSSDVGMAIDKNYLQYEGFNKTNGTLEANLSGYLYLDTHTVTLDGRNLNPDGLTDMLKSVLYKNGDLEMYINPDAPNCKMPSGSKYYDWYSVSSFDGSALDVFCPDDFTFRPMVRIMTYEYRYVG